MTDSLHLLFSAWGDPSPESRAAKTDAAIGPNFYYSDPNAPGPLHGRAAYLDYIAQFGAVLTGGEARVAAVTAHHGHALASVDFLKDGEQMLRGYYFADFEDGKVVRLIGFSGMGEPA
ncbi:nuclear transport factor 2 family protein [Cribrihabitans pelagius]|uniref:nuclear transport factor 2 family protein n=1 Tax=Cribrihabitans pelagius TaxID=1765746 RepID=UPI003B5CA032